MERIGNERGASGDELAGREGQLREVDARKWAEVDARKWAEVDSHVGRRRSSVVHPGDERVVS